MQDRANINDKMLKCLHDNKYSNYELADAFNVDESTIRYHLKNSLGIEETNESDKSDIHPGDSLLSWSEIEDAFMLGYTPDKLILLTGVPLEELEEAYINLPNRKFDDFQTFAAHLNALGEFKMMQQIARFSRSGNIQFTKLLDEYKKKLSS